MEQGLASCAPGAGHRHEGTHADSRLLSGVAIRHADRKPCLRLPSVATEVCEERAEVATGFLAKEACCIQNEKDDLIEKIVRWYGPELVIVAKSGLCPKKKAVRHHCLGEEPLDVRHAEG